MQPTFGNNLRTVLTEREILPLIGVYDVFSASLAAQHFDGIFLSGYGFAASHYGLPDIGFIAWSDIVAFAQRVRTIVPHQHIVVDIDDGYADAEVACHVVALLESAGASGVVLEDQMRPRRCGHLNGKQILPLTLYLDKLQGVLRTRRDLFVVARTDATDRDEILRRVEAFSETDADAVLVDGVGDPGLLAEIRRHSRKRLVVNQIAGGAAPPYSLEDLRHVGVSLAIYSTPCLFAAQAAIDHALQRLHQRDGLLEIGQDAVTLRDCNAVLDANLLRGGALIDGDRTR